MSTKSLSILRGQIRSVLKILCQIFIVWLIEGILQEFCSSEALYGDLGMPQTPCRASEEQNSQDILDELQNKQSKIVA